MAATYTLPGVLLTGLHSARPAASAVASGTLYAETDTGQTYQSDGVSTWTAWGAAIVGGSLEVKEVDGSPDVTGVTQIIVSNGTLTDNTGGSVTVTTGGGGGSDVVNVASGAGSVTIPGLKGSPDAVPGSPSAYDDEFNALSGWTTLGSPATLNVTDVPSNLHVANTAGTWAAVGIYKACPTPPFTVTTKLSASAQAAGAQASLILLDTTPSYMFALGQNFGTGYGLWNDLVRGSWTLPSTRSSASDNNISSGIWVAPFLRFYVGSTTSVTCYFSMDGLLWLTAYTAQNPGFTIAKVGVGVQTSGASVVAEAFFDWIRFS